MLSKVFQQLELLLKHTPDAIFSAARKGELKCDAFLTIIISHQLLEFEISILRD